MEVLASEPRVVALPAAHPLARSHSLTFADLRAERFITGPQSHNPGWREQWTAEQEKHGLPGDVAAEAASVQEILTLVAADRGVCLVPLSAARLYQRSDVAYVVVTDADPAVVSIARPRVDPRPVVEAFVETARQVAGAAPRASPPPPGAVEPDRPQVRGRARA